jgi:outer membrane protein OmpA-like peptidoglycan-associated protein
VGRAALLLGLLLAYGAYGDDMTRVFVACPIYRDTDNGRKSGCWLATDPQTGERYDVSGGRSKPQIGREALVEGKLEVGATQPCGAVPLSPVYVSVLPTSCPSVMLPAEGYPGRKFQVSTAQVLPPVDVPRPPLEPPFKSRSWSISFTYRSDFLQYQYSEVILDEIARYVLASRAKQVTIHAYAVTDERMISGHPIREPADLAQARADMVSVALSRLGVPKSLLKVTTGFNPAAKLIDGLDEPSRRRVDIDVEL